MRVVVLGAGYAGLTIARRLESSLPTEVEIVVVNETDHHLIQHELHRIIRRPAFADDIKVPLSSLLDRSVLRTTTVSDIAVEANRVTLANDEEITYDIGAVCLGAQTAFYGLPGLRDHGIPLKRLPDAASIRTDFLEQVIPDGIAVVGGAGLSGVQVAGELAALAREHAAPEVEIVLLEQEETVAPGFPAAFQDAVHDELIQRDVTVRLGREIEAATASAVKLADDTQAYDQLIWTGGIEGPSALGGERPEVPATLRVTDDTFVVGDAARSIDRSGEVVPATAQAAVEEARTAATNIQRLIEFERNGGTFEPRLSRLDFRAAGWIVSIGDGAVAQVGPTVLRGRPALALKMTVGLGYLSSVGAVKQAVRRVVDEFST